MEVAAFLTAPHHPAPAHPGAAMLRYLSIEHLAVIERVEIEFDAGLNVLTGETGAGKSILVEAVGLLLGARASSDLVRTGEDTATIQAIFDAGDGEVGRGEARIHVRSSRREQTGSLTAPSPGGVGNARAFARVTPSWSAAGALQGPTASTSRRRPSRTASRIRACSRTRIPSTPICHGTTSSSPSRPGPLRSPSLPAPARW